MGDFPTRPFRREDNIEVLQFVCICDMHKLTPPELYEEGFILRYRVERYQWRQATLNFSGRYGVEEISKPFLVLEDAENEARWLAVQCGVPFHNEKKGVFEYLRGFEIMGINGRVERWETEREEVKCLES